jgi:hypothetical protein
MKIYAGQILRWGPCVRYSYAHITEVYRHGLTPREVAQRPIPLIDRLWVLERWLWDRSNKKYSEYREWARNGPSAFTDVPENEAERQMHVDYVVKLLEGECVLNKSKAAY